MAFWNHPATFAVVLSLTLIPLMAFRLLPFKPVLTKKELWQLWGAVGLLMLANIAVLLILYRDVTASETAIRLFKYDVFGFLIVSYIPFAIVLRRYALENLFVFGTVGVFALLMLSVGTFIVAYIPLNGLAWLNLLCGALLVIAAVTYPLIKSTLTRTVTPFLGKEQRAYWKNIWIIPNAMLVAMICTVPMTEFLTSVPQLISRLLIGVATVLMCRSIAYDTVAMTHRIHLESQIDAQKEYYRAMTEKLDGDRRARHDFQHMLAAIAAMADKGETEEIREYCLRTMAISRGETIPYTGNAAVDGVLYRYTRRAQEAGVPLELRGCFKARSAAEIDVCVALGNALENALTAAAMLPPEKRFVTAELLLEGELLTVTVKNSYDGVVLTDENDTILSRKRDHEVGYGIDSIKAICKAHGGTVTIHRDDETFAVMMLMNIEKG